MRLTCVPEGIFKDIKSFNDYALAGKRALIK